ncbi:MAG TPA: DUF6505 family protein [Salinisphaeraceae bacterium]|nr:DUF6505 family protein [Salinisphaeraceae bacterium]
MLRTIRFDASDEQVFPQAAQADEWAVPGGFAFSFGHDDPATFTGKQRQAFANGFLGLNSFGRATLVTVADCRREDYAVALEVLTAHLLAHYGAPDAAAARRVAADELAYGISLCEQPVNTLLSLRRELTADGIEESFIVHDARPLWERDTRIFTPVPESAGD